MIKGTKKASVLWELSITKIFFFSVSPLSTLFSEPKIGVKFKSSTRRSAVGVRVWQLFYPEIFVCFSTLPNKNGVRFCMNSDIGRITIIEKTAYPIATNALSSRISFGIFKA